MYYNVSLGFHVEMRLTDDEISDSSVSMGQNPNYHVFINKLVNKVLLDK